MNLLTATDSYLAEMLASKTLTANDAALTIK